MKINTADFVKSCTNLKDAPSGKPEYAFIGRSNVGKSSLINMLLGRNSLAKISSKPGKTQLINYFIINEEWHIVDLPGYGYAKTSKKNRELFSDMIKHYIFESENLMTLFILIDSRIPPQESDLDFIYNMGANGIPIVLVFTKIDKISKNKVASTVAALKRKLSENWEDFPPIFLTSTIDKTGQKEILDFIQETNELYIP
ncbi:MAG: YihA family ribosome biogenesis GTP-binding protein [Bacteroidales bacterium]|nr:YihA family ribosome biogenesis GTP-binding protein [Bacteroidales bacterium]